MSELREPLQFVNRPMTSPNAAPGHVTLMGAGPGDPDLLTVKAARVLSQAKLVLYDHLVDKAILNLVPASADRVFVGKAAGRHSLKQEAIIDLMLSLALAGRSLVRLKGGDPYIFGRGGEEAEALVAAGVPFDVIPGISAAQAAGALAGLPLTHRDHAQTLVLATGHLREDGRGEPTVALDWEVLARPRQTVVIYMGLGALPVISRELIAQGRDPHTPAALVERASRPEMRTVVGTLATLPTLALTEGVKSPALIVIGEVVTLHAQLGRVVQAASLGG